MIKKKSICVLAAASILRILLPDQQINKKIYNSFENMTVQFSLDDWIKIYIYWELSLIKELGYEVILPNKRSSGDSFPKNIEINEKYFKVPELLLNDNSKKFGRLAILCNWRLDVIKHFDVSKNCFFPKPKVNSTVLSFKPKKNIYKIRNPKNLENVTRVLFSNRRKMINKSFLKLFRGNKSVAGELNLNLKNRPEDLSKEMFYKITIKYEKLFC